jgi:hypothetical protein
MTPDFVGFLAPKIELQSPARTASFSIIGHQLHDWECKFLQSKITGTQASFSTNFDGELGFHPVFPFSPSTSIAATHIFNAHTCTTCIITLKPHALNAEFQQFVLRFDKISLLSGYHQVRVKGLITRPKTLHKTLMCTY